MDNPPTFLQILSTGFVTAFSIKILDILYGWFQRERSVSLDTQTHGKKILLTRQIECIEILFLSFENARHSVNTGQPIKDVNTILSKISKANFPRKIYFSPDVNSKIETICDEIKNQASNFTSLYVLNEKIDDLYESIKRDLK